MKKTLDDITTLDELWKLVLELNQKHFPDNDLMPILGGGATHRPKVMFVFINPTVRNISSGRKWKGPRFPFIGTKQVWRIFHKAGFFDDELVKETNSNPGWSLEFTRQVQDFLREKGIYLTNIVKWTGSDAQLPTSDKIKLFLPLLKKEIEIVRPEHIVTFGLIPFENMTGQKIRLSEYHDKVMKDKKLSYYYLDSSCGKIKVIPSYFPVGRGDPKKAIDVLRLVSKTLDKRDNK
ncbi:MAG: uracil-DNA glycosylase family protein [Nanoarchaeota archaeon]|nr:uracil-DNA glycosylase family protein [Nanoarchaeota archaeon]